MTGGRIPISSRSSNFGIRHCIAPKVPRIARVLEASLVEIGVFHNGSRPCVFYVCKLELDVEKGV
ncbi:hypothetical protein ES705_47806 [subsurface metagenome]